MHKLLIYLSFSQHPHLFFFILNSCSFFFFFFFFFFHTVFPFCSLLHLIMSSQMLDSVRLGWRDQMQTEKHLAALSVSLKTRCLTVSQTSLNAVTTLLHTSCTLYQCIWALAYLLDRLICVMLMSWTVYLLYNSRDVIRFISSRFYSPVSPSLSFSTGLLFTISLFFATCCIICVCTAWCRWVFPSYLFLECTWQHTSSYSDSDSTITLQSSEDPPLLNGLIAVSYVL